LSSSHRCGIVRRYSSKSAPSESAESRRLCWRAMTRAGVGRWFVPRLASLLPRPCCWCCTNFFSEAKPAEISRSSGGIFVGGGSGGAAEGTSKIAAPPHWPSNGIAIHCREDVASRGATVHHAPHA